MDDDRWRKLMNDDAESLTPEEIALGWHFCPDFDGLLIGPDMPMELKICQCGDLITEGVQERRLFPDHG